MKKYLYSIKNVRHLRKYICIQSKIFAFNEKYFCSLLLFSRLTKNQTRTSRVIKYIIKYIIQDIQDFYLLPMCH